MADKKAPDKGAALEEILKFHFWNNGYFAVRGVPFRIEQDDITDIDIWLYERPVATARRKLIVDAKNKKVPRAAERLVWARGLQVALNADGAIVASTDKRHSSKRLAKLLGVTLLDGDKLQRLSAVSPPQKNHISSDEFDELFKAADAERRTAFWKTAILDARAALLAALGIHSANIALRSAAFFAEQAALASPNSHNARVALRGFYSCAAYVGLSLDHYLAEHSLLSAQDRQQVLNNGLKFGHPEGFSAIPAYRTALALIRQFGPNGNSLAREFELNIKAQAQTVSAEILSEYVSRIATGDTLYILARELENSAYLADVPSFDTLSSEGKSFLGVMLDFFSLPRENLAQSVSPRNSHPTNGLSSNLPVGSPSLFDQEQENE
ncbi:hypothetical protein JHL21_12350 [Devosia sp. WQ 349]|uniref:hypothetical protein n=1 Tax=Devosia sp. WQ 349K1 TaxID=2800329 RepID=UPI001902E088|nr:hypothetical protein [Devosia sp. WQ 349K1]MBK1795288.1 hypothetical protein [Devosia sp. WQ 349K1]